MVYVHNVILFNHKKEWNNAICSNMDGPRDCHTEWSKSEKDKYDIVYMWNLKKMVHMNLFTKQSQRCRKQIYGYQEGSGEG